MTINASSITSTALTTFVDNRVKADRFFGTSAAGYVQLGRSSYSTYIYGSTLYINANSISSTALTNFVNNLIPAPIDLTTKSLFGTSSTSAVEVGTTAMHTTLSGSTINIGDSTSEVIIKGKTMEEWTAGGEAQADQLAFYKVDEHELAFMKPLNLGAGLYDTNGVYIRKVAIKCSVNVRVSGLGPMLQHTGNSKYVTYPLNDLKILAQKIQLSTNTAEACSIRLYLYI